MLKYHPACIEELTDFYEGYLDLNTEDRAYIRQEIEYQKQGARILVLGNPYSTKKKQQPLAELFDYTTFSDILQEMQVVETIRITYLREQGPSVTYWTRTDGKSNIGY